MDRRLLALAATALTLLLPACGSESSPTKLSSGDENQLLAQTDKLGKELQNVTGETVSCVRDSALKGGGKAEIQSCLEKPLEKAGTAYADSAAYVSGLAAKVSGDCKPKLQEFADSVRKAGRTLSDSAKKLAAGDISGFQQTLSTLAAQGTDLQKSATAIGPACSG